MGNAREDSAAGVRVLIEGMFRVREFKLVGRELIESGGFIAENKFEVQSVNAAAGATEFIHAALSAVQVGIGAVQAAAEAEDEEDAAGRPPTEAEYVCLWLDRDNQEVFLAWDALGRPDPAPAEFLLEYGFQGTDGAGEWAARVEKFNRLVKQAHE